MNGWAGRTAVQIVFGGSWGGHMALGGWQLNYGEQTHVCGRVGMHGFVV